MKRKLRKNATELSVFVVKKESGEYDIIDPSMDGDLPIDLFNNIMGGFITALKNFNAKVKSI